MTRTLSILIIFTFVWQITAQRSDFKNINFKKADDIAMSLKGEALNNLPILAYKLTYTLETDVERFRAIYIWVCHNIENDYDLMQKNKRKHRKFRGNLIQLETWNTTFKKEVFYTLLNKKKTLCSGYAYLIKALATYAGLQVEIVKGYGKISASFKSIKMPNHAWNTIKLNGKWYVCDATWASGFITDTLLFEFNYNNDYFLMEPQEFAKSHKPIDAKWLLYKGV